jgi:hypothetical protein
MEGKRYARNENRNFGGHLAEWFLRLHVGTREYAKKEKKSCTFCHAKVTSDKAEMVKNLNAVGACYKEKAHSLATCEAAKK